MNIDFQSIHERYLTAQQVGDQWLYRLANHINPKSGKQLVSHQVFSNHGLQAGITIYNTTFSSDTAQSVSHALTLTFSRKVDGKYLLRNDDGRISFYLDLGHAKALYRFVMGLDASLHIRLVRSGRAPKSLFGACSAGAETHCLTLTADEKASISVQLSDTDSLAIASFAIGYGRLLYPSLSDVAIQQMFMSGRGRVRACAEAHQEIESSPPRDFRACAESLPAENHIVESAQRARLKKAIWAIGQNKWPSMRIEALQKIQMTASDAELQRLVDQGNDCQFQAWDAYLLPVEGLAAAEE